MRLPRHHLSADLTARFAALRVELDLPDGFGPDVESLAGQRSVDGPFSVERADHRDLELSSIDPAGSRDLDQAFHLSRRGSGYRFHYAIADLGAWVAPGDAIDLEARRRGSTIYCPDRRVPLHPVELSEGAASLLAGAQVPAVLWTINLDQRGDVEDHHVERTIVRNRRALSYADVQAAVDRGDPDDQFRLLEEIGTLRAEVERRRGGISLGLPEQHVERVDGPDGGPADSHHYELSYDAVLDVEGWNAQLSLCCGMVAADAMLAAGVGILRTLPAPDPEVLAELRRQSEALGISWPESMNYPDWVRALDTATPEGAALVTQAARTLRGSGYVSFDGTPPADHRHHAIAADYAHVTAPLRRLADRFANECVIAAADGRRPSPAVLDALPELPVLMGHASRVSGQVDHAVLDIVEAAALEHLVGTTFDVVVTSVGRGRSTIQLRDPAVIGSVDRELPLGTEVSVRLVEADSSVPTTRFEPVS